MVICQDSLYRNTQAYANHLIFLPGRFHNQLQAQPEQMMFAETSFILQHTHERRVFVEKADFISSVGYLNGNEGGDLR